MLSMHSSIHSSRHSHCLRDPRICHTWRTRMNTTSRRRGSSGKHLLLLPVAKSESDHRTSMASRIDHDPMTDMQRVEAGHHIMLDPVDALLIFSRMVSMSIGRLGHQEITTITIVVIDLHDTTTTLTKEIDARPHSTMMTHIQDGHHRQTRAYHHDRPYLKETTMVLHRLTETVMRGYRLGVCLLALLRRAFEYRQESRKSIRTSHLTHQQTLIRGHLGTYYETLEPCQWVVEDLHRHHVMGLIDHYLEVVATLLSSMMCYLMMIKQMATHTHDHEGLRPSDRTNDVGLEAQEVRECQIVIESGSITIDRFPRVTLAVLEMSDSWLCYITLDEHSKGV